MNIFFHELTEPFSKFVDSAEWAGVEEIQVYLRGTPMEVLAPKPACWLELLCIRGFMRDLIVY